MSVITRYTAKIPFTYDGISYKRDDYWKPNGSKFDKTIIESGRFVNIIQEEIRSEYDYSQHTVRELREICSERDLPVYGNKEQLIQRLEDSELLEVA